MNKSTQYAFLKKILIWTLVLAAVLSGCSDSNSTDPAPSALELNDAPVINNILTQDQLIWVPYYHLPSDWQINRDNPESARSNDHEGLPVELKVYNLGSVDQNPQIVNLRDQLYQQVFCQQEEPGGYINCARGFAKTSQTINGFPSEGLRYYGTWQDNSREVNENFINHNGQILHITSEGDFQKTLPALESILQTIQWKLEKPSSEPAQQSEEIGL